MSIQKIIYSYYLYFEYSILILSGNEVKLEHLKNNPQILVTFLVFHFDISGNIVNDKHSWKMHAIFQTFIVFHLDISGNDTKLELF